MDKKQDLETEQMWSAKERVEPKMTPRLRAEEVGVTMALDGMRSEVRRFWEVEQDYQWETLSTHWRVPAEINHRDLGIVLDSALTI